MRNLRQLMIVLGIYFSGELTHKLLHTSVPGNVIGMIILIVLLCTGIIKIEMIDKISKFLLDNLAFFFVPIGVGLMSCFDMLQGKWVAFILVILISTIITLVTTGLSIQLMKRWCK